MSATASLRRDHRLILRVLIGFDLLLDEAVRTGRVDDGLAGDVIEFFEVFGDGIHHMKEEDVLFPAVRRALGARRSTVDGSLEELINDHDVDRRGLEGLRENLAGASRGQPEALRTWVRYGRNLTQGWRRHMAHEEEHLFPLAERTLDAVAAGLVAERCEETERSWSEETRHRMHAVADRLAARYGVRPEELGAVGRAGDRPASP